MDAGPLLFIGVRSVARVIPSSTTGVMFSSAADVLEARGALDGVRLPPCTPESLSLLDRVCLVMLLLEVEVPETDRMFCCFEIPSVASICPARSSTSMFEALAETVGRVVAVLLGVCLLARGVDMLEAAVAVG